MAAAGPGKKLCGAKTKTGTCRNVAGKGTDHLHVGRCSRHLGRTANHAKAAEAEIARRACATLGVAIETGPGEALLRELCETVGNVAFYRALVQELPAHPVADVYVAEHEVDGEIVKAHWQRGDPGVYGRTYHVSGIPTGEAKPHILVQLYNAERKHLKDVSAAALSAGVQERAVAAMEDAATTVVAVLQEFCRRMAIDPLSPEAREAGEQSLRLIAGGQQ